MNPAIPKKSPKPGKFASGCTGHAHANKRTKKKLILRYITSFVGYQQREQKRTYWTHLNTNKIVLLLLDLSAAFDIIDHIILLKKLKEDYKIGGTVLCWFRSNLENRSFTVSVGDKNSNPGFVWFGVPQGSILGLFAPRS